jgi:drug/metabolite transporter (DMT)-like permease
MRARVWLVVIVASLGWGTGGVSVRAALNQGVPPYALTMWRAAFAAAAVLLALALRRRPLSLGRSSWRVGAVMGVANFGIPFIFWTLALQYASAGFTGLLAALIPITTAVLAHFFLPGEPLEKDRVAGLLVALAGVATLMAVGDSGLVARGRPVLAGLLTLVAVVLTAASSIYAKKYAGEYDPLEVSGIQFLVGSAVIVVVMLVAEGLPGGLTGRAWLILLYAGLVCTFLPSVLYFWLLRHVTATYAAIIGYTTPVVALVVGAVLLDEQLQAGIALGGVLILVGVVLTDRAETRSAKLRPEAVSGGRR